MNRIKFDVGIVVPLKEELRYVMEVAPQIESFTHQATYFYRLDFGTTAAICCLVGQMGLLPALHATNRLLEFADVKLVVVLGLGGALDNEVAVGDVVIATEVNEFQWNSKAEQTDDGYSVRYSGRSWQIDFRIRESISHFEFAASDRFLSWQNSVAADYAKLDVAGKEQVCAPPPSLHLGPIASGNVVSASSAFVTELKQINRKFMAIDMEAAGVELATTERIPRLPCLIVRGISDTANEDKKVLEENSKGAWRRYCVRNAASLLRELLAWEGFQEAAGLRGLQNQTENGASLAIQLVNRLKTCIGGPWIVGVAFGIYSYGPRVTEKGNVIPMDFSRLRVADPKTDILLASAEEQRDILRAGGQIDKSANVLAQLVQIFRDQTNSLDADRLLQDFDKVVIETILPGDDNQGTLTTLLVEAERIEESAGAEAVIDLLKQHPNYATAQPLRERYIDALAKADRWTEIVKLLGQSNPSELMRNELENLVFACAKSELFEEAKRFMKHHQDTYDDRPAKLFRLGVGKQYSRIGEGRL